MYIVDALYFTFHWNICFQSFTVFKKCKKVRIHLVSNFILDIYISQYIIQIKKSEVEVEVFSIIDMFLFDNDIKLSQRQNKIFIKLISLILFSGKSFLMSINRD